MASGYFSELAAVIENRQTTLREKCQYLEIFWSVFPRIRAEYGEILRISPYSVPMQENTDQKNSEYVHFPRIANLG